MKKSVVVFLLAVLFSASAMAQTVQEGVANWYAERYQSARQVFEKLTAANPNNLEAVYWLGQTLLAQNDVAGAKSLYQKTLAANGNAPWILAGMGQIDLMEGRAADAKTKFDQAIAASKGKKGTDPAILNAVGRAIVQPYSDDKKVGDIDFAIARLNEAAQAAPTSPDIAVTLGNAYRKKHAGGDAVQAYRKAGTYAPALYRTASIYKTQKNWDAMVENLNAAIAADPKFAPAYEDLYYYYLTEVRDFAKAESFGKLYVSNSDPSVENDYLIAQTLYVQKRFDEAIATANKILQQTNNNPKPRVFRLLSLSTLELKDTAKACDYSNQFFAKATQEDMVANDYLNHAKVCGRGNPTVINADIDAAQRLLGDDKAAQIKMLNAAITDARSQKLYGLEAELMQRTFAVRGTPANAAEQFYVGTLFYYGENFPKSDTILTAYIAANPDSVQGYYWRGLSRSRIDTAMTEGLAVADFEKTIQLAEADKVRFKNQAVQAAQVLTIYYYNNKKDKAAASAMAKKGLEFDPTNASLLDLDSKLSGTAKPAAPAKTETKTKTTTDSTKTKTKTKSK